MAKKTISRDTPLAEITLRKYEKPANLGGRELVRKLCLSLGLLQPGDSRDVVVDILHATLKFSKDRKLITMKDIENSVVEARKLHNLPIIGVTQPNIARQIRRLKELSILEKNITGYRIAEFSKLHDIFEEKIENFLLPSINSRIKDYLKKIDAEFNKI